MKALQFPEFNDLSFCLSRCGQIGQRLGNRSAVELEGQAEIGAVAWILGLMAMAVGFATAASVQTTTSGHASCAHVDRLLCRRQYWRGMGTGRNH